MPDQDILPLSQPLNSKLTIERPGCTIRSPAKQFLCCYRPLRAAEYIHCIHILGIDVETQTEADGLNYMVQNVRLAVSGTSYLPLVLNIV